MSIENKENATIPLGALVEPTFHYLGLSSFPDIGICIGQETINKKGYYYYNNIFFLKSNIIMLMSDTEVKILKEIK